MKSENREVILNLEQKELDRLVSILQWYKIGCQMNEDDLLLIEKLLHKFRRSSPLS